MTEDATFDDRVAGAFARHGLNSLLLDIKQDIGGVVTQVTAINQRLAIIEPALWQLESDRQRKIGLQQGIKRFVTVGRAAWLTLGGGAVWAAQHFSGWLPR